MDIKPNLVYSGFDSRKEPFLDQNGQRAFKHNDIELTVRQLKDGVTIDQAAEATAHNGLDEVFFESEGKQYVAYGNLGVDDTKEMQEKLKAGKFDGKPVNVIKFNSEVNHASEGFVQAAKALGNTVAMPFRYLQFPNAATSATFIGGMAAGALSQLPGGLNLKMGLAIGGVTGAGTIRYLTDQKNPDDTNRALKSGATGVASVALGAAIPHTIKFLSHTSIPQALTSSAKTIALTAAVGSAIALTGGALAGALNSADYTSLEKISE